MSLLAWLHERLGYRDTPEMLRDLAETDEGFDADGRSHVCARLLTRSDRLQAIGRKDLLRYDDNIRKALAAMNAGRKQAITLRYFQYLAALYAEVFLDFRFNRSAEMLASLNDLVADRNIGRSMLEPSFEPFEEADLDKLALWMATGSGKTLLLHLNYRQFLNYSRKTVDNVILITPNEGLSEQHLTELGASGIRAERFSPERVSLFDSGTVVQVTEITKLVLEKKGGGESVPVGAFEGRNLIFVDEGHKGSGGDAWRQVREAIAATGFTFEYSATFGQALTAARNDELTAQYGKAIGFDYSYRHFYGDGYGKDFNIVNLQQTAGDYTDVLLLANLLAFYQQQVAFAENQGEARRHNLERPLWTLVGASVNVVYTEKRRKRSDVLTAARFLHRVLADGPWATGTIRRLLAGESGLVDDTGRDVFKDRFDYLRGREAVSIHDDLLKRTLHTHAGGGLHIHDIRGAEGELGLKAAGADDYFGLIYIGDTPAFKKLVQADDAGITLETDAISGSLFDDINRPDTTVEMLLGARKFLEGWNSWRVSSMGLLNLGRSEGAQIIQMFGRGVRLRGRGMTLKRSAALEGGSPAHIRLLETLNVFALRANYMSRFREYLEREGVPLDPAFQVPVGIRPATDLRGKNLVIPRLDEAREFKAEVATLLQRGDADTRPVVVDLSGRAQVVSSGGGGMVAADTSSGVTTRLRKASLDLVDWNAAYIAVLSHRAGRGFDNLAVDPRSLREFLEAEPAPYSLIADDGLAEPETLADLERLQQAVVAILRRCVDVLYRRCRARWESDHMVYKELDEGDPNFQFNAADGDAAGRYIVSLRGGQSELIEQIRQLFASDAELYEEESGQPPRIHFDRHLYQPLLVERPGGVGPEITSSPLGLNEGETRFVKDLRDYWIERSAVGQDDGREIFLLRNLSRHGVGFFASCGFYPDFILWINRNGEQRIVFIEPHGMVHARAYIHDEKARLHERLPDVAKKMAKPQGVARVTLDSFIVSRTAFDTLRPRYDDGKWTRQRFAEKHILFQERRGDYDYMEALFREPVPQSAFRT